MVEAAPGSQPPGGHKETAPLPATEPQDGEEDLSELAIQNRDVVAKERAAAIHTRGPVVPPSDVLPLSPIQEPEAPCGDNAVPTVASCVPSGKQKEHSPPHSPPCKARDEAKDSVPKDASQQLTLTPAPAVPEPSPAATSAAPTGPMQMPGQAPQQSGAMAGEKQQQAAPAAQSSTGFTFRPSTFKPASRLGPKAKPTSPLAPPKQQAIAARAPTPATTPGGMHTPAQGPMAKPSGPYAATSTRTPAPVTPVFGSPAAVSAIPKKTPVAPPPSPVPTPVAAPPPPEKLFEDDPLLQVSYEGRERTGVLRHHDEELARCEGLLASAGADCSVALINDFKHVSILL